jgi:ribonucleoside-diphosphate reductase alpha chain
MKRRGGVGTDISTLRPNTVSVTNAAGSSTGPVSFMERYSNTTREVAQDGRRGALMITIDCRHPDVLDFINIKKDRTKVTGANISVNLRDDFMRAVENDEDYILRWPCDQDLSYFSKDYLDVPYNYLTYLEDHKRNNAVFYLKRIRAKEYYDAIVENAWENAEPGQMFIDRHHDYSPESIYPQYKGVTTNPCGEIFMQPYDACRLIALNLTSFVNNPYTPDVNFDYNKLYEFAYEQQRLADDIVDLEIEHIDRIIAKIKSDPESEEVKKNELDLWNKIKDVATSGRRTGCGFTGLGDVFAMMGCTYGDEKSLEITKSIMYRKFSGELDCTIDLSILRGAFKGFDRSIEEKGNSFSRMYRGFALFGKMIKYGRRNVSWSTVAPTGTVSLMTQTTSGLEPIFQPFYMRRRKINPNDKDVRIDFTDQNGDNWMEYPVLHPEFKRWMEEVFYNELNGYRYYEEVKDVWDKAWTKESLEIGFKYSPWYGSTANDIDWISRVKLQSIIQKFTTHSISSTINLPEDVSKEEVAKIYLESWKHKLKGVTIYRDNCRTGVLVNTNNEKPEGFVYKDAPKRPEILPVEVYSTNSRGTRWNVIVGLYDDKPYEVFAIPFFTKESELQLRKCKKGKYDLLKDGEVYRENITSEMNDEQEVITRLVSTSLRHGADITFIVEQLNKSHGDITSFSKAIARILSKYVNLEKMQARAICGDCGSSDIIFEEGCQKCLNCGNSKCG